MTEPLRVVDEATGELRAPGCPECHELATKLASREGDIDSLARELATVMRQRDALKRDKEEKMRADKQFPDAMNLFDEWRQECGHPNAEFDPARIRLALSAVRRYKKHRDKLSWVIQYGKHLAYVDEKGEKHDGFGLLFRDSDHIERYANNFARWQNRSAA